MDGMPATPHSTLWTIGHSTRSSEELLSLLNAHEIVRLVDVRRYPGSRRYPHFHSDALKEPCGRRVELSTPAGIGRPADGASRFTEPGLEKCRLSRLRRLHADRPISAGHRRVHDDCRSITNRDHVRGSGSLALSSLIDRRCPCGSRMGRHPHPGARPGQAASPHGVRHSTSRASRLSRST